MKKVYLVLFALLFLSMLVSAEEYALDIKIGKSTYSSGENVDYKVILLKDGVPYSDNVRVFISDVLKKKSLDFDVETNKDNSFTIENDFPSGFWQIEVSYNDKNVKRLFTIGEREEAEFSIEGDNLIIKNTGNVPYTKTVQIIIGEKAISQKQYIEINDYKEIKLVAPDGIYDIMVTDGATSISKSQVTLTGTGNVIGALDEQIINNDPLLGGARENLDSYSKPRNYAVAFLFILAVFGLFILLLIERMIQKKRAQAAKGMLKLH